MHLLFLISWSRIRNIWKVLFLWTPCFAPLCADDKGEAASEAGLRLRAAGEGVRREVGHQHAAAGGGREGSAPHRPQRRGQELRQEEHLQSAKVKRRRLARGSPNVGARGRRGGVPRRLPPKHASYENQGKLPLRDQHISLAFEGCREKGRWWSISNSWWRYVTVSVILIAGFCFTVNVQNPHWNSSRCLMRCWVLMRLPV